MLSVKRQANCNLLVNQNKIRSRLLENSVNCELKGGVIIKSCMPSEGRIRWIQLSNRDLKKVSRIIWNFKNVYVFFSFKTEFYSSSEKFGDVLESSSKKLHLREHTVIGGDNQEHRLITRFVGL